MEFFTKKSIVQKIMIVLIALILVNFVVAPYKSYAAIDPIGSLLKSVLQMLASLGDIVMGALNNFMLGADSGAFGLGSALLDKDDDNITGENGGTESWLYAGRENC